FGHVVTLTPRDAFVFHGRSHRQSLNSSFKTRISEKQGIYIHIFVVYFVAAKQVYSAYAGGPEKRMFIRTPGPF
ncbi:hypothetical protein DNTS_004661, partial [Danionella cerebrum]